METCRGRDRERVLGVRWDKHGELLTGPAQGNQQVMKTGENLGYGGALVSRGEKGVYHEKA